MCYLIAKKYDQPGCIALETTRGKRLAGIVSSLGKELAGRNVQILSVTDMDVYGEYKPYTLVSSEKEFLDQARAL